MMAGGSSLILVIGLDVLHAALMRKNNYGTIMPRNRAMSKFLSGTNQHGCVKNGLAVARPSMNANFFAIVEGGAPATPLVSA
ncbi:MAG: hypothetical protein PHW60_08195 [Kiritimatiellae bacterium]|nr:hypothetical protein [Kiritimatiellia bacterium]